MNRKRSSRNNDPSMTTKITLPTESLDKRSLRLVPLAPPDFVISPKVLLESFVEKEVLYAGTLSQVPPNLDITRRAEMLSWVDSGYSSGQLNSGGHMRGEQEVIVSINAQNVKLSGRYPPEEVILRVPIEELASVVYLRDDGGHLVLMLHSTAPIAMTTSSPSNNGTNSCFLSVLLCDSRMSAEEICALVRQCFHLVYTEATMCFLDSQLSDGSATSGVTSQVVSRQTSASVSAGIGSPVSVDGGEGAAGSHRSRRRLPLTSPPSAAASVDGLWGGVSSSGGADGPPISPPLSPATDGVQQGTTAPKKIDPLTNKSDDVFENYMSELRAILTEEERVEFAGLLRSRQQGAPFPTFCRRLLQLFTLARIHLLEGFRPFVDACDRPYLDEFIAQHNMSGHTRHQRHDSTGSTVHYARSVSSSSDWSNSASGAEASPAVRRGTGGRTGGEQLPASFDQRLSLISHEINSLESLVQVPGGSSSSSAQDLTVGASSAAGASASNLVFSTASSNLKTARF